MMTKIKLFCFPYAGGSAVAYNKWRKRLDPQIDLRPVELAGRGRRINDSLYQDLPSAIEDIYTRIKDELDDAPYAFFGHSMGAMIAYELAHYLQKKGQPHPPHLFLSGRSAPHINRADDKKYHLMPAELFKEEVISLGGTPPEFFEYPELLELYLPVLKNDFKLAETYLYEGQIRPLDCSITSFFGKQDDLTSGECEGWKEHTTRHFSIRYFEGGHFFLHEHMDTIIDCINTTLLPPRGQ